MKTYILNSMKTYILNSMKAITATALISGGIALSAPTFAITPQGDLVTTKIDIRDLETDRGIAKVYEFLARRAEIACVTSGNRSLSTRKIEDACTENLLTDFVQDVDDTHLTAYYQKMSS